MRLAAHQHQHALIEELKYFDDLHERLTAIVERAQGQDCLPAAERIPAHRVPGCTSHVWLKPAFRDGHCYFKADADSPVVRGLAGLLAEFFSGITPEQILAENADPLVLLNLAEMLTPTRRHGLAAIRTAIRAFADQHLARKNWPGAAALKPEATPGNSR
jgi:cysteine desulfuration protein SufE